MINIRVERWRGDWVIGQLDDLFGPVLVTKISPCYYAHRLPADNASGRSWTLTWRAIIMIPLPERKDQNLIVRLISYSNLEKWLPRRCFTEKINLNFVCLRCQLQVIVVFCFCGLSSFYFFLFCGMIIKRFDSRAWYRVVPWVVL